MKFLATHVILAFSLFYRVTSGSAPSPTIEAIPAPLAESTASRFVYLEQSKVNVTCSFPIDPLPEGVELELLYHVAVYNPVFGGDRLPEVEGLSKDKLEVQYVPNVFLPLLNFTCTATNRTGAKWQVLSSSTLEIEQLYKTGFVIIQGSSEHKIMQSGDILELKCLADGNPLPRQYQWYNRTKDGDVELPNETRQSLQFVAPAYGDGESVIVCGAKNQFNKEVVKSDIITVTSLYYPTPTFSVKPSPTDMSTSEKLVFLGEPRLTVGCSLPGIIFDSQISVQIVVQSYEPNPAHPEERLSISNSTEYVRVYLNYNPKAFIPIVNIACIAINRTTGLTRRSSKITIEQKYKISEAIVQTLDGKDKLRVDAGERVRLECLADGNPKPEHRWYNSTEDLSENRLEGETDQILDFVTPSNWSTGSSYSCGAKNKFNTNFIKSVLISVISLYVPPPVFESIPSPTDMSTSKKLVFLEEPKVTVKCSIPNNTLLQDVYVKMELVDREPNPVYPQETGNYTSPYNSQMSIEYNPERFIPFFNLSCRAVDRVTGLTKKSSNILVEQQYKTMNVIVAGLEKMMVIAGETVRLECLADGNPKPEYQWYRKIENSDAIKIRNESQRILEVVTPTNESTTHLYICGAKNKFNTFVMKAEPVSVTSLPRPYPIMDATPTPSEESSDGKFVYLEQRNVSVTCTFPITPLVEHVDLQWNISVAVHDPVFEHNGWPVIEAHPNGPLRIEYQQDIWTPIVRFTCTATNQNAAPPLLLSSSTQEIEQLHRTRNIRVYGPFSESGAYQGILRCVADGNPPPQYQWFHETRDGFVSMPSANTSILQLTTTPDVRRVVVYRCGARNEYNSEFVMSTPTEVTLE